MFDVIVVGGSYAGISAAMQLGRARRSVLVIDGGERRNRFAPRSHGFLGQDGVAPEVIAAKGRAEVLAYPTVGWREGRVDAAREVPGGFDVRVGAESLSARRLVLATGVRDELPAIAGLEERWGRTIFHCPYCHGYELDKGRLGVLATGPMSMHSAVLVSEWAARGQMTFFLNGAYAPDDAELADLAARGIQVERERVEAAFGDAPIVALRLADARTVELDGLFLLPRTRPSSSVADVLGCELAEGPLGPFYKTDPMKETTVPGVFACGDAALPFGAVALAVADGAMAGTAAHRSLVFRAADPVAR